MAWTPNNANAELQAGMAPTPVTGRVAPYSHTLGQAAGEADQGLDDTSARWSQQSRQLATTPHSVLSMYSFNRNASANGSSGQNFMPGYGSLGSGNAMSPETFDAATRMRMARSTV